MILYRISNFADLLGIGGTLASGRWHSRGRPIVYLSDHPALAMLETLVHFELDSIDDVPDSYKLLRVETSVAEMNTVSERILGTDWATNEALTQNYGDLWLEQGSCPLLKVPSVVMPHSNNYIYNPAHDDAAGVTILDVSDYKYDNRLVKLS